MSSNSKLKTMRRRTISCIEKFKYKNSKSQVLKKILPILPPQRTGFSGFQVGRMTQTEVFFNDRYKKTV